MAVPVVIPVTVPVAALTDATDGLLLVHVPPGVAFVNVLDDEGHTIVAPLIAPTVGVVPTVMVAVAPAEPQLVLTV